MREICLSTDTTEKDADVKNIEACKISMRKNFIFENFLKSRKCVHCKTKRMPLRKIQNTKILMSTVTTTKTK
jgi:hypothetical protein